MPKRKAAPTPARRAGDTPLTVYPLTATLRNLERHHGRAQVEKAITEWRAGPRAERSKPR